VTYHKHELALEVPIAASRKKVFKALTRGITHWWAFQGSLGKSKLILEPKPGGRLYEDLDDRDGYLWATVIHIQAPSVLKLCEAPGTTAALQSHFGFELEAQGKTTLLKFACTTVADESYDPACTRDGWEQLLKTYLKRYIEEGKSYDQISA